MPLGPNRWGKSEVRLSKVFDDGDFMDLTAQVLLEGDVEAAHTEGDNSSVLPTDTMRNTVYALAQEHLTPDLEAFAEVLCHRFLERDDIHLATVTVRQAIWSRASATGYLGGGSLRRVARVTRGTERSTSAGIDGLVVLKTTGSAFTGFPRDEFTILPEAADRLLATSVTADWSYDPVPVDTTNAWERARAALIEHFFGDWSGSVQHQGYLMGEAVLAAVPEATEIRFRLPNQHHLPFDLTRFGMSWDNTVFQPVSEPYGDIYLTVTRA